MKVIKKWLNRREVRRMPESEVWRLADATPEYMQETYPDGRMTTFEWGYERHQTEQRVKALEAGEVLGPRIAPDPATRKLMKD